MKMIVLNEFTDFFQNLWNSIYQFWFTKGENTTPYIYSVLAAICFAILAYFINKLVLFLLRKGLKLTKNKLVEKTAKGFLLDVLKVFLYLFDFVVVLFILRVDMSGISTVFSSAILAIGLALQSVFGNFASGLIILSNKHFEVGDYISIKDCAEGTVLNVKFLSTILQTVDGQKVIVSNSTVINNVITNYSNNPTRRLNIGISFSYEEKPEVIRKALLEIIKTEKSVLKTPEPYVVVTNLDSNGATYNIRCLTNTIEYWDILFRVNEKIVNKLQDKQLKIQPSKVQLLSADLVAPNGDK